MIRRETASSGKRNEGGKDSKGDPGGHHSRPCLPDDLEGGGDVPSAFNRSRQSDRNESRWVIPFIVRPP